MKNIQIAAWVKFKQIWKLYREISISPMKITALDCGVPGQGTQIQPPISLFLF